MRLLRLKVIGGFKNLDGADVCFDPVENLSVIIGKNRTGKSNLTEAIVTIFKELDKGASPSFSYELTYSLGTPEIETLVSVDASSISTEKYQIFVTKLEGVEKIGTWESISIDELKRDSDGLSPYLPRNIFAYYSGPSDRLEKLFFDHRAEFYKKIIRDDASLKETTRPLFYVKPFHSQFALLAFFVNRAESVSRTFLRRVLAINDFHSATFVLKKSEDWGTNDASDFWGAKGAVRDFLELIRSHCMGPIAVKETKNKGLTTKSKEVEFTHYFLSDADALIAMTKNLRPEDLFKILEATYLSGVLERIDIQVTQENTGQHILFSDMSEGEQQLLTIFGLLQFTGRLDSLFLLDEPDTHLNPNWAAKYHSFLDKFVPDDFRSHIIMTTHHPLAIAELDSSQIQVIKRDTDTQKVTASNPKLSPKGMSVNGILTSDMFGMLTTLDNDTQKLIAERRGLVAENTNPARLEELNAYLEQLGYGYIHPDEDYRQFLIARSNYLNNTEEVPSVEARKKMIRNILSDMEVMPSEIH